MPADFLLNWSINTGLPLHLQPGIQIFAFHQHKVSVLCPPIQHLAIKLDSVRCYWLQLDSRHWYEISIPAFQTIYPTTHYCVNTGCARNQRLMLKKSQSRQVVLFTLSRGAVPAWATHLYCDRMPFLHLLYGKLWSLYRLQGELPSEFSCGKQAKSLSLRNSWRSTNRRTSICRNSTYKPMDINDVVFVDLCIELCAHL